MTSEPATPNIDLAFAAGKEEGKFEARAAAERDVAALRDAITHELELVDDKSGTFDQGCAAAYNFVLSLLANPAAAEPRWPSGPDAEQELAAAFPHSTDDNPFPSGTQLGGHSGQDWLDWYERAAPRILAALQEKPEADR